MKLHVKALLGMIGVPLLFLVVIAGVFELDTYLFDKKYDRKKAKDEAALLASTDTLTQEEIELATEAIASLLADPKDTVPEIYATDAERVILCYGRTCTHTFMTNRGRTCVSTVDRDSDASRVITTLTCSPLGE